MNIVPLDVTPYEQKPLYEILDGFTLNPAIRAWPGYFMPAALGQMDVLRRATRYRAKYHLVPDQANLSLAAYQTLEYEVRVIPGTYVWGLLAIQVSATGAGVAPVYYFKITDACNGVPFSSDFVASRGFGNWAGNRNLRAALLPHLLCTPRLVIEPGLLAVELANPTSAAIRPQLILCCTEPCEIVEDVQP